MTQLHVNRPTWPFSGPGSGGHPQASLVNVPSRTMSGFIDGREPSHLQHAQHHHPLHHGHAAAAAAAGGPLAGPTHDDVQQMVHAHIVK